MKKIYSAEIINKEGRTGTCITPTGEEFMDIVLPEEKLSANVTNPEQLFAAAYSAWKNMN